MSKDVRPDSEVLQYAIYVLDSELGQSIPEGCRQWYEYLKRCAVDTVDTVEEQRGLLGQLNAENKTRLEFIDWMHLKELYRLYRYLKNQAPFFDPDREIPDAMMRMTDDIEHRIDGKIDRVS